VDKFKPWRRIFNDDDILPDKITAATTTVAAIITKKLPVNVASVHLALAWPASLIVAAMVGLLAPGQRHLNARGARTSLTTSKPDR
jgi:hypothetical protein